MGLYRRDPSFGHDCDVEFTALIGNTIPAVPYRQQKLFMAASEINDPPFSNSACRGGTLVERADAIERAL
jgi:hypothetical protein